MKYLNWREKLRNLKHQNFLFKKRYSDIIRMICEGILSMALSTRNGGIVIKLVLEKLAGIECNSLGQLTFSKYMLIEAHGLVQLQIASKLAGCEEDLVLTSMGQARKATHLHLSMLQRVLAISIF